VGSAAQEARRDGSGVWAGTTPDSRESSAGTDPPHVTRGASRASFRRLAVPCQPPASRGSSRSSCSCRMPSCLRGAEDWDLLDDINLAIHETGHLVFSPIGDQMGFLGGSLFQVIVPGVPGLAPTTRRAGRTSSLRARLRPWTSSLV